MRQVNAASWRRAIKARDRAAMEHFRFSTDDVGVDQALAYWADGVLPQLEAQLVDADSRGFTCSLSGRRRAELAIGNVAIASYSGVWRENARLIGCTDSARVFRVHQGLLHLQDRSGSTWQVKPGEAFISGPDALISYAIAPVAAGGVAMIADMTTIPLKQLQKYGALISRDLAHHLAINSRTALFNHYVDTLRSEQTHDVDLKRLIHNFTELTAITLTGEGDAIDSTPLLDAHFARAARLIRDRFRDGNLTAAKAAKLLGLSERALFKAFELRERSFHQMLVDERLVFSARRLRASDENVTSIAYDAGFESVSTFNRNFRFRFGMSPTDYRASIGVLCV
ncbi:MAG TPA: helix-turn-helix transcriptional regulator [Bosea sp. (in: a-proteobacteria)]|uniref:helix-turn-helix transcriptional regulator n=1 Tax=Bosea sp. (in: a-proteobacteria) TaxID=1871050 RepID=UPI002E0E96CF|nr:helix-turn-helix transcriptional regulator [Bosea sp. (in: a-proteobacteria)]